MKILFKMTRHGTWGDKMISIPYIYNTIKSNPENSYFLLTGNYNTHWEDPGREETNPKKYDPTNVKKINGTPYGYFFHPHVEPVDCFENLYIPTLGLEGYYDLGIDKGFGSFKEKTMVFDNTIDVAVQNQQIRNSLFHSNNIQKVRLKCNPKINNKNYSLVRETLDKTKNIVVYANYDPEKIVADDLPYGRGLSPDNKIFKMMMKTIRKIDDFCLKNPEYRIVIINKRSTGFEKFLNSNFFNLIKFENHNLTMSQLLYLIYETCNWSVGSWCTFGHILSSFDKIKSCYYLPEPRMRHRFYDGDNWYSYINREVDNIDLFLS